VYPKNETPSRSHSFRGKTISITYSKRVFVALGIQHANCIRSVILQSAACLAVQYFSTLSHKRYNFRKRICSV